MASEGRSAARKQPPAPTRRRGAGREGELPGGRWRVDRDSAVPAYAQIESRMLELIESGRLQTGDRVPSERALAAQLAVSRLTARAALDSLARRGVLERGPGRRGTRVARSNLVYDLGDFAGFTQLARRRGVAASARIRSLSQVPAHAAAAAALGVEESTPLYRIERVRFAEREAVMLEESWIPAGLFPGLLDRDLRGSLYALMRDAYDRAPVRAVERLQAELAGEAAAEAMGLEPGSPLMLVERVAYDARDTPVEFARDHHRGDRATFVVDVSTRIDGQA